MSDYGATQTSTSTLNGSSTDIPVSANVPPGETSPVTQMGGPKALDSNGKYQAPLANYVYDGYDQTFGAKATVASTDSTTTNPFMAFAKGVVKILADVWDSTNHRLHVNVDAGTIIANPGAVGTALAPYGSNPTQTAAAGVDTLYKFGTGGTTSFNHVSGQNNTAVNAYLAFDQSTTVSGDQVYVLAPGQAFSFDRAGTVLHFSSPTPQSFGGQSGITVEAFA